MNQASPASPASATMEAFFTRQKANEGIELPLTLPDGTPTPHLIRIRGIDSDAFKAADAEQKRRLFEVGELNKSDKTKITEVLADARLATLAALVVNWTFDQPCTPENIKAFLKEAPQIADQIDRIAARRSLFFAKGSTNSTPSPAPSSS